MGNLIQVSGSVAFDTILQYEGNFRDHIALGSDTALSASFFCPQMKREHGGCAANISYNLRLLNQDCVLLGSFGFDGKEYLKKIKEIGIDTSHCEINDESFTAQAIITTDSNGNQLTSFHPGAMAFAGKTGIANLRTNFGIVSPNSYEAMLRHAKEFKEKKIPFIFDPGQALPMFSREDIVQLTGLASWIAVNEHESNVLCDLMGEDLNVISKRLDGHETSALIQTLGHEGVKVFIENDDFHIKALKTKKEVDPTGCGDAFRAGFLYGLNNKKSIYDAIKLGNAMGYVKVQSSGAQNHMTDPRELESISLTAN